MDVHSDMKLNGIVGKQEISTIFLFLAEGIFSAPKTGSIKGTLASNTHTSNVDILPAFAGISDLRLIFHSHSFPPLQSLCGLLKMYLFI